MTKPKTTSVPAVGKASDKKLIILMMVMFAAGFCLSAYGGYEMKGALEARSWPQTEGTIIASSVTERTRRESNHRTRTTYFPQVHYRYQVDGHPYTGSRIQFGVGDYGGGQQWAQKVVDRYPTGKKVTVYYKLQEPHYAVLEAGFNWRSLGLVAGGGCFFGVGVLCLASHRKASTR
jgi:hypothetical protein